jgi:hypothetical protein
MSALGISIPPAHAGWSESGQCILDLGFGSRLNQPRYRVTSDGHGGALLPHGTIVVHLDAQGDTSEVHLIGDPGATTHDVLADGAGGYLVLHSPFRPYPAKAPLRVAHVDAAGATAPGWPDSGATVFALPAFTGSMELCDDGAGGAFVKWTDNRDGTFRVRVNHVSAAGGVAVADGALAGGTAPAEVGHLVPDGAGGAVVAWRELANPSTGAYALRAQRFDASCVARWGADGFPLATSEAYRLVPVATDDGAGGAYFAWEEDWAATTVRGLHVEADGDPAPGWSTNGSALSPPGDGAAPSIARDLAGGCYVAWRAAAGSQLHLSRRRPDGSAESGWTLDGMFIGTTSSSTPSAALLADGQGAHLVWTSGLLALAARAGASGGSAPLWSEVLAQDPGGGPIEILNPAVVTDGLGGALAFWQRREDLMPPGEVRTTNLVFATHLAGGTAGVPAPGAGRLAIAGAWPNPSTGDLRVSFALAGGMPAALEVLDVAGRRVAARDVTPLGPGGHVVRLDLGATPAPGVYVVRLTEGPEARVARVVLTR